MSGSVNIPTGFTSAQFEQLCAILDTFYPSLPQLAAKQQCPATRDYYLRNAVEIGAAQQFAVDIHRVPADLVQQIKTLLWILSTGPGTLALTGSVGPFSQLSLETREQILVSWSSSMLHMKRSAFGAFKQLAGQLFYSLPIQNDRNPNWDVIGYPGPDPAFARAKTFDIPTFDYQFISPPKAGQSLSYDVVIVGSGCGGGVVASELAQAGYRVLVLEKSTYVKKEDMSLKEYESLSNMFENGGLLSTEESSVAVLAGSTFGGGSTINWSASLRTPKHVTDEWAKTYKCPYFATPQFQDSIEFVQKRMGVHDTETLHSTNNHYLKNGCDRLNYSYKVIPRNAPGSHSCGYCTFGCKSGEKQGCVQTFLADAARAGAHFMVQVYVDQVLYENNQATGVLVSTPSGFKFQIKSKIVCVSAGSIQSPALLLRSKIPNPNIGKNLRLHPVSMVIGFLKEKTTPWDGCMMSIVCKQFEQRGDGYYGSLIETPPAHPGIAAAVLPWKSAEQARQDMLRYTNMAVFIVLVRDRDSGAVTIDQDGRPRLSYNLSDYDYESLKEGMEGGLKIMTAAGADMIATVHSSYPTFKPFNSDPNHPELLAYLKKVRSLPYKPSSYPLYSAHQMGTCRMGGDRSASVLRETGESWDIKNLYVADASTFPTSSGVNPMITTFSISHSVAQNIKARLQQLPKL
eukprot:TRINITY_DN524_c0_g6_i1.p1 TRINITY_DN524_c0_g6~~TRINITY_DN524_c0_g6_i1.p1  ORF type:complete len:685 (-),score=166.82 TRINITY_DN524_c0_g6_i1:297-2351(-)